MPENARRNVLADAIERVLNSDEYPVLFTDEVRALEAEAARLRSEPEARILDAADRLFMHGILDEIADDAMHGGLDKRDAHADAETIARIVLNQEQDDA